MSQTDNKEILVKLLVLYKKEVNGIDSYNQFMDYKKNSYSLMRFIDKLSFLITNKNCTCESVEYKTSNSFVYSTCLYSCVALCLLTLLWIFSHSSRGHAGYVMSKQLHPISYRIEHILEIISIASIVLTFIVSKIDKRMIRKEKVSKISFETYKNNINYMIYKLKETPWQEVDKILKQMKAEGVEFPKGVNFKV